MSQIWYQWRCSTEINVGPVQQKVACLYGQLVQQRKAFHLEANCIGTSGTAKRCKITERKKATEMRKCLLTKW